MSTIDTSPSNNSKSLEAWSGSGTHMRVERRELVAPPSQSVTIAEEDMAGV